MATDDPHLTELVRQAHAGEVMGLAAVLEHYRAPLQAQAVQLLGHCPEAEDAVHETFVIALTKIGTLRDPAAFGGWIRRILHNVCLMQLRRRVEQPVGDASDIASSTSARTATSPSVEQTFENLVLRDWVWHAIEELSEPLRLAIMLRFFTSYHSYDSIAAACAVPVGTVRSRLNAAKRNLAERLLLEAATLDSDARRHSADRAATLRSAMNDLNEHHDMAAFTDPITEDAILDVAGTRHLPGLAHLVTGLQSDFDAGVKLHLTNVVSSKGITVAEGRFENPDSDPDHCPPATVQIHHHPNGHTERLVVHYARDVLPELRSEPLPV